MSNAAANFLSVTGHAGLLNALGATVSTAETTSSLTYTNLATTGPSVTIVTGTTAIVVFTANASWNGSGNQFFVAIAVSGATTIAAADADAYSLDEDFAFATQTNAVSVKFTGLTPGSNTFTMKYRVDGGGPWTFQNRVMWVVAP